MVQRTEFHRDGYDETVAVQRARTGEDLAFREIYERYYPGLRRYIFSNTTNPHDAEDVMQDIFAKAFQNLESFNDMGDGMKPWLTTIARNSLINLYRRNMRYSERHGGELDESYPATDNIEETIVDQAAGDYLAELLLAELSPERRDAFEKVALDGIPYKEYAADAGIPKGTALSRVSRARQTLRDTYDAMQDELAEATV